MALAALAVAGCGQSAEEKASRHPPDVFLIDHSELVRASQADDPLAHIERHGRRLDAPRYEGWFHDMAELYFQAEHDLRLGTSSPQLGTAIADAGERGGPWLSVYGLADRWQGERVEAIDPSEDELGRFHTEFVAKNRFPGWPERPEEVQVAGQAMRAWVRAYPRLIAQIRTRTALVIAWDGDASADRVAEMAR